jgi:hypothetical protein
MALRTQAQLTLALSGQPVAHEATQRTVTRSRSPQMPGARPANGGAHPTRPRTMPSRDSRGRFVSCPTSTAPSSYVLCTDGYRVPGDLAPEAILPPEPTVRQPLPRAVAGSRPGCKRIDRADPWIWLVLIIGYLALGWYGLHLPRPHR